MSNQRHSIQVDYSERESLLLGLLRQSADFEVRLARLRVGDYLINDEVLLERKTIADFAASLVDGRLFPQAARLARDGRRSLVLIEGPPAASMPDVHPHAVQGCAGVVSGDVALARASYLRPRGFAARDSILGHASRW